jgi:para-nitrobenzyl esterase
VKGEALGIVGWLLSTESGPFDLPSLLNFPYGPAVDGYVLPDAPLTRFSQGKANPVSIVAGTNASEMGLFKWLITPVLGCADYANRLAKNFGTLAPQVEALYPCDPFDITSGKSNYIKLLTHVSFECSTRRALRALAAGHSGPIRRYYFTHTLKYGPLALLGAFHGQDLLFVFNSFGEALYAPTPGETALSKLMQGYWRAFAATGDPNFTGAPLWRSYDATLDNALALDETPFGVESIDSPQCDFWDAHM